MSNDEAHEMAGAAIERARDGGIEALNCWADDETLISSEEFAHRRGWTTLCLHRARGKGAVFSIHVRGRSRFVAMLAELPEPYMFELVDALRGLDIAHLLLFCIRRHGALGGETVLTAYRRGAGERILELARGWVEEGGIR